MNKRAVIYTRVSDPSQIDNNSLDSQEEQCRKYAVAKGYKVVEVFVEEGKSAKHIYNRPKLRELFDYCYAKKNKISAVVVYKSDRFSRNVEEGLAAISRLAKHGVEVLSVIEGYENSPMGRAIRTMVMAMDQLDNEMKGERVKDNMQAAFRKGFWVFKCPVGYKRRFNTKEENRGIPPIINSNLGGIITKLFHNAATGIYNKTQLAELMNRDGFGDHYRTKANHKIVNGILKKTFYYGRMYAPKWDEYADGLHKPLIDETTWQKAYHLIILKKKSYKYQDTELYPLKGALKCGECNHPMTTSPSRGNGGVVNYYECKNKGCKKLRINANKAHEQFEDILSQIEPSDRVIKLFEHMVFEEWDKSISQTEQEIERVEERINGYKSELKSIIKAKDDGLYTPEQAKEEADKAQQEIMLLGLELADMKIEKYDSEIVSSFVKNFMKNLPLLWEKMDLPKKQALLSKVFMGELICHKDRIVRTNELSPSFQVIESMRAHYGGIVTLRQVSLNRF